MKALDELSEQVLRRDEEYATEKTIESLKGLLIDVEEYGLHLQPDTTNTRFHSSCPCLYVSRYLMIARGPICKGRGGFGGAWPTI